jgi:hypothetical protein
VRSEWVKALRQFCASGGSRGRKGHESYRTTNGRRRGRYDYDTRSANECMQYTEPVDDRHAAHDTALEAE